jgi:hypothetical protein
MATGMAEQAAILRDAPLRSGAPQDEVRLFHTLFSRGMTCRVDATISRRALWGFDVGPLGDIGAGSLHDATAACHNIGKTEIRVMERMPYRN